MQIKIKNLRLENFKGIRELSIDAQGKNVSIYGENATGKTTIYDAFSWLLQEKDSQGKKDFGIKTLENGIVIEGIDHTVECEMDVDGKEMKLKKVYSEKWTKKTGTASKVLTGHTTDYYIDDVPCKKSEFESSMSQIISEDAIKLLTNPRYFNEQMHWLDRKKILFSLCDEIADTDVIEKMESQEKITSILAKRLPEDHKKVVSGRLKEINNQLEKLPIRIDEINKGMQGNAVVDVAASQKEIDMLKSVQEKLRDELSNIKNGGLSIVNGCLIADLNTEISNTKTKMQDAGIQKTQEWQVKINILNELKTEYTCHWNKACSEKTWVVSDIEDLEKQRENLRDEWKRINAQIADIEASCPTCNQAIPQEKQQEALKAFNLCKSNGLEIINTSGKAFSAKLDVKNILLKQLTKDIETYDIALKGYIADIEKLNSHKPMTIWVNDEILAKQAEIERLEAEIKNDLSSKSSKISEIAAQIDDTSKKIETLRTSILKSAQLKASKARIAELKAEQKKLSAEYENLESELFAINQFERIKCNLIEDTINSKFENAKFKLFNTLVNGGLEECCETLFDGVPYADLNNAAKTNVGIDIINTLSKQYGIYLPIFVDNSESITKLQPVESQLFRLVVSDRDKELRIE